MKNTFGVYLQVYKMQIIRSLTYKFDVYGNILMQLIIMAANSFFWKAIFRNSTTMKGVTVDTMLTYTVISSILSILLTTNVNSLLPTILSRCVVLNMKPVADEKVTLSIRVHTFEGEKVYEVAYDTKGLEAGGEMKLNETEISSNQVK